MSELNISRSVHKIEKQLKRHGVKTYQCYDFDEFEAAYTKLRGQFPSGQFRQVNYDFLRDDSFWIKCVHKGEVVCAYGARLDDLGSSTLSDQWKKQQPRVYSDGGIIGKKHCSTAFTIKGRVVYTGECYISESVRGKGLAPIIVRLGLFLAYLKWHYDYIYSFMSPSLIANGFGVSCGYLDSTPNAVDWKVEPEGIPAEDFICYSSGKKILELGDFIANRGLRF